MIYLSGVHSEVIAAGAAERTRLGLMAQPHSATVQHAHRYPFWAFDNGAFGDFLRGRPFRPAVWLRALGQITQAPTRPLFAVVPDAVGDHAATLAAWDEHLHPVLAAGLVPAFVLQNGCRDLDAVPLAAGAVFIGGDDAYKLGDDAARVCWQARAAGMWTHMGRVNSERRWRRALAMGCDSADGTFLRFGEQRAQLARMDRWFAAGRDLGGQTDLLALVGAALGTTS